VLSEHGWLLVLGLACGTLPALVAVLPAVRGAGGGLPLVATASIVLAVAGVGAFWVWLATAAAARGPLVEALRND
ncbi:MAG: hypothetical protein O7B99_05035, partial [Planctomycetota bacterium]|nr:hypothetical protein [Planctomycetota bacterium]